MFAIVAAALTVCRSGVASADDLVVGLTAWPSAQVTGHIIGQLAKEKTGDTPVYAAARFMVPADGVLPIASRPGAAGGTFEVDVRLPAGQALCVIDNRGTIVSLERA